jgi:hypothetical protein
LASDPAPREGLDRPAPYKGLGMEKAIFDLCS